jgi:DNA-binding transcriptional MocR family regulator
MDRTTPPLATLLDGWAAGDASLNEQLADSIEGLVRRGELVPGTRLPSERDLAASIGVSRTTVVSAYARLRELGLIRSRQGSGWRVVPDAVVNRDAWVGPFPMTIAGAVPLAPVSRGPLVVARDTQRVDALFEDQPIALTIGALRGGVELREPFERAMRDDLDTILADFGYHPLGLPMLRTALAAAFTRSGLPTSVDQMLVTTGSQQAIHLLADELVGPDGVVAVEDPTYVGALDAFRVVRARMLPIPVGPDGMRVEVLSRSLAGVAPALVYVVPSIHNPTGAIMPEAARRALAELAVRRDLMVVEDLTPVMTPGHLRLPPIASFAPDRIITIGSLSKGGWGGLRIGWIRSEPRLIMRLAARKATFDHGTAPFMQAVAARMLEVGDDIGARAEALAAVRRRAAGDALREYLPDWRWSMPVAGLNLWVTVPDGDTVTLSRVAATHGVVVRSGAANSPQAGFRDHLRIACGEEPDRLTEGIRRLAAAWRECEPQALPSLGVPLTV